MTRILNEEFLTVHPATQAWWDQRAKCEACRHVVVKDVDAVAGMSTTLRCRLFPYYVGRAGRGRRLNAYCIDARADEGKCGPDATMFDPKA